MDRAEYEAKLSIMSQWDDSIRTELAGLISKNPPQIVYHYTDQLKHQNITHKLMPTGNTPINMRVTGGTGNSSTQLKALKTQSQKHGEANTKRLSK